MAWPHRWSDRLSGWAQGSVFRMDWSSPWANLAAISDVIAPSPFIAAGAVLGKPALVGPDRSGHLLAFSAWAVDQAQAAWRRFQIRHMTSAKWYIGWLNGISPEGAAGYRSGLGLPGVDLMDCGEFQVLFCPEVLGPLARIDFAGGGEPKNTLFGGVITFSEGLQVRMADEGWYVRGAQLPDGYWRCGRVEPIVSEGGWWFLPVRPAHGEEVQR